MAVTRVLGACITLVVALTACSSTSDEPSQQAASTSVDPQVFTDVVEAVFKVPGETQRRGMRVETFIVDLQFEACGQTGPPLDATGVRFSQDKVPILSLIAEKGFVEDDFVDKPDTCTTDAPVLPLPRFQDVLDLRVTWTDTIDGVLQDESLTPLRLEVGSCLAQASGLELSSDVPSDFLRAVDEEDVDNGPDVDVRAERAEEYAACTSSYFQAVTALLLAKRPAAIERNRELLTTFATELVAAGYVP